jgi:hypothetical protein
MNIGMRDLRVGGRYVCGRLTRVIDKIIGDDVIYHDEHGSGCQCTKKVFIKKCARFADGFQPFSPHESGRRFTIQNLSGVATGLAILESQHVAIARAVQPLLSYLDEQARQKTGDILIQNLSQFVRLRKEAELIIASNRDNPVRKVIINFFLGADLKISETFSNHQEIAEAVTPFFWRLGEKERSAAALELTNHATSITRLRNEIYNFLSQ